MKLKNLNIGLQLRLGLGVILVLVALLGLTAWWRTDSLWQETKGLYDHPLMVRRALGELRADILTMHAWMDDLLLTTNVQERQTILQMVDTAEANAHRQFEILFDRYLGPRNDVEQAFQAFVQWKAIRAETLRLLQTGKSAEAMSRVRMSGLEGRHVNKILEEIRHVSEFAINRGDQFYQAALQHKDRIRSQLGFLLGCILLLSLGVSYGLLKGIREPLRDLTAVADQFRQGQLDARSGYQSANEFGRLAATFNALAETVQTEMEMTTKAAQLAGVMLREEDLRCFSRALLPALVELTGSQVGALYLLNKAKTEFTHFESLGLTAQGQRSFSATSHEGEFGAALATRQLQHLTDIPSETRLVFSTVSGDFAPREIITLPILSGPEVTAVISLASVRSYSPAAIRLVKEIWSVLTARLNGVLAFRQLREFSVKLEQQNQELEAQQRELTAQKDELSEQNIELELQKKQLDEASRLKSVFLSNMSHELRTPLNSVIALSGVLSRRLAKTIPAEEYGYLAVIERNGQHLLSLINDILDLSRIESGKEEINLSSFSLRGLVAEIVAMLEPQAREKNLALINQVADDLPNVTTDLAKCRHILQNIIGNAVKFTEQGQVEIAARAAGSDILLAVRDTGIGIAADQLPRIFDEFHQADISTSRKYGGTGLGLAIARKYAQLLHGHIAVESTPGQGSTFTLTLPLTLSMDLRVGADVRRLTAPPEVRDSSSAAVPPGQGQRILVVEDSEPALIQLTDILTQHGYQVQAARHGQEALDQIERAVPDAMILDLMMPQVDGFQVLRAVRGSAKTARLPVLILTAKYVTREELSFLKGNRIQQLIQKGDVNKTELLAAIAKMVAPPGPPPPAPAPRPKRPPHSGKPVILVVEDNPDNLMTLRALLRNVAVPATEPSAPSRALDNSNVGAAAGASAPETGALRETCIVLEATDGQAALALARQQRPDLILMDIALPGLDGFQALAALRQDEALRHIPVVAVTASAMKGDRQEILGRGFDGYLAKPIDAVALQQTIREMLAG